MKIGKRHPIVIHQTDRAHASSRQIKRRGGTEPAGAETQDARRLQLFLPGRADLGQHDVARITPALLGIQPGLRLLVRRGRLLFFHQLPFDPHDPLIRKRFKDFGKLQINGILPRQEANRAEFRAGGRSLNGQEMILLDLVLELPILLRRLPDGNNFGRSAFLRHGSESDILGFENLHPDTLRSTAPRCHAMPWIRDRLTGAYLLTSFLHEDSSLFPVLSVWA